MYWLDNRVKIYVTAAVLILIGLSIWGLASLESFYRNITLAQLPVQLLIGGVHAIIFVFLYTVVLRGGFTKIEKKSIKGHEVNVRFSDVIGIDEAKEESWEVVQLIKDHKRLKSIGGKILRGILMIGPPGCGKTYLAKAIATEAGLPFLSMAGSEFVEVFVGVGPSRVRSLFKKARSLAYGYGGCVVFVDELDAIGKNRTYNQFGNSETNSTQNQLLVEMDGLSSGTDNIIVIGATNSPEDSLDPALLRPGRFDRKVYITRPNLDGRKKLFDYYMGKVKHDAGIDTMRLARKCVHHSPAEIENIVKESALITVRNQGDMVTYKEISEAIERIQLGFKTKIKMNDHEKKMTAFHEAGHLITTYLLHPTDDVFKASIIPRKDTLGVVHRQSIDELFTQDRNHLLGDIKTAVAGYVAEKLKNNGATTSGVASDFKMAMVLAHNMVWKLGMGTNGFIGDYTAISNTELSDDVKTQLNRETHAILSQCIKDVEDLLKKEDKIFERFADELFRRDELEYDDIEAIFAEYGKINPRQISTKGFTPSETKGGEDHSPGSAS